MALPVRTFSADVGQTSTGNRGPDAIETDIDSIIAYLTAQPEIFVSTLDPTAEDGKDGDLWLKYIP